MPEHCVTLILPLSDEEYGSPAEQASFTVFERAFARAVTDEHAGQLAGAVIGGGEAVVWARGQDADTLFAVAKTVVDTSMWAGRCTVIKRFGEPGVAGMRREHVTV
jgi:hypothetical protein